MAKTTKTKKTINPTDISDVITPSEETVNIQETTAANNAIIPDSALINVKSNVFGKLIFNSKRNGERIVWQQCGDVQQLTLATLRNIKTESINFFKEQWILILGFADENAQKFLPGDIYKQLYVAQYYAHVFDPANYEVICSWSPNEIHEKISLMSEGAKENLVVALNTYIEKGILDSVKAIKAFEKELGCDLRELG